MDAHTITESQPSEQDFLAQTTSELNNLLQIIAGTSSLVERACAGNPASESYIATLRATIERAEELSAKLVKRAGGPIERSSTNDQLASDGKPKPPQTGGKKPRIMIVDDEQVMLGLISRVLSEADYEVSTAQSGFECLDHFRRQPFHFDLVLLDLTMPFMDGEETFHRLRELRPDIPVVKGSPVSCGNRSHRMNSLATFARPSPISDIHAINSIQAASRSSCKLSISSN
jgi:hypothetical protein